MTRTNNRNVAYIRGILCILLTLFTGTQLAAADNTQTLRLQSAYADVAEKAMPAVVTVYSLGYGGINSKPKGVGSGFLITSDGFIVTNHHVIKNANIVAVKMFDGKTVEAEIVGVAVDTDLAVLKIASSRKLPYLKFADTESVRIGHYAIAIGSPFSLSQTMTTGIVSYKGRELGLHYREDYIQTDAAINPGNSGGPLLNIEGKVIGVNDCLLAPDATRGSAGSVGLGFAIDGNLARIIVLCIIKNRFPDKPYAGIVMSELNKKSPPVIAKIVPNSPAEKAGFRVGDRITKIGNRKVLTIWDVQTTILALYDPGDEAEITFLREEKTQKKKIKFGKLK